ncbi:hypothetical protein APUTEX25_003587, partial [Auxenochlorella protothecoides]
VRLLSISDLAAQVSFGSNPLARPRQVSGGAVSVILDLASFQAAAISLHGFELREEAMLHSAFRAHVAQVVQGQVFGVGVSLVRNFGVIGGAGKVLGMLSAGVAKLSQSRSDLEQAAAAPVPETKPISNFGDGFAEGAGAFGSSILRGLRGVVEKPREGARQRGFQGALSGVAKGLVGAVADPISGALDAMSATAQGMDAFMSKSKAELLELGRRRLPRVMSVDGAVTPTLRDGSFREARMEELGQALLQNTLLAAREKLTRTGTVAERYEQHFLLPDNRVVVLTDRGILLLHAPGFDRLGAAADLGYIAVSDVPPGEVSWRVSWEDLLALELRLSRESPDAEPDRLIVHRKGVPGRQQEESLAHQIKGYPNTPQASQIKMVAQAVYKRRYLEPLRSSALCAGNGAGVVEEVLEHQRWRPRVGWAGSNLHPRDPARFEHGTARRDDFPQVDPPRGWEWDSGWQLDRGSAGEKEGWVYAPDFSRVRFPAPDAGAYKPSPSDTVRVRRWVRRRVRAGSARRGLTPQASLVLEAPPAPRPPRVVGVVASGSTLPLPVGWDRSGSQLLLRPAPGECGGEEEGEAGEEEGEAGEGAVAEQKAGKRNSLAHSAGPPSHGWSEGAGAGTHTVLLDCLDESVTRLVRCAPLAGPDAGGGDTHGSQAEASISRAPPPASAAEASSLWFAVTLESSPLAEAGARDCEAPLDWRVVVAPPLTLVNQLPLAGSLLVWQEDPATGQLVSRQTLRVRSGQCAPVHGADLRSAAGASR